MRAQFILNEIGIGIRRNLTMTIAVVVTVTISLFLAGAGLLVHKQVKVMQTYWYGKVEVSIFLCGESSDPKVCNGKPITEEQRAQLNVDLLNTPQVAKVTFESHEQAYEHFRSDFKDSPDLINNVTPEALPESYRVKLKDSSDFLVVASAFQDRPGVESVTDVKKQLDPLLNILRIFQNGALVVAGLSLLSAIILISQTIRLSAFSRRRETGIMRLVGASNLYIQTPFLFEGAIAGFIGGLGACGLLSVAKYAFVDKGLRPRIKFTNFIGWPEVFATFPWILLAGVGLSALASFFTLRRHLRV